MLYRPPIKNEPISTLIKCFVQREKGKLTEARYAIKRRFDYLDWKDQKKIIIAFLSSCKTDRDWIYVKLLRCWDKTLIPFVQKAFEEYHESRCSWSVIRYFPTEYLLQNKEYLSNGKDYYFLCKRLIYEKVDFELEPQKLTPRDYLTILIDRKETISNEEAIELFYSVLYKLTCDFYSDYRKINPWHKLEQGKPLVTTDFEYIYIIVQQLKTLGCNKTLEEIEEWNKKLYDSITEDPDFKNLSCDATSEYDFERREITRKHIYNLLPERFKKQTDYIYDTYNNEDEDDYDPLFEGLKPIKDSVPF